MKIKVFQKGFNYSQDGRGNRLVLHLQGCNMHCPWCSNPEGMELDGVLFVEKEWLKETCCVKGAVKEKYLDRSVCNECRERLCIQSRQKGIRLSCQEYEVYDLLQECEGCRAMFFEGGGVTLTGGEITIQFAAVKALLEELKAAGINTAIESNGSHPGMGEYLPLVDEWIMDIKHMDEEKHKAWLGTSNRYTIKNIRMAAEKHGDVLVRIPLIPGFNDSREEMENFIDFLKDCAAGRPNVRVEILPYHEFGKGKWEQCGYRYTMKSGRISRETQQYFEKRFQEEGILTVKT